MADRSAGGAGAGGAASRSPERGSLVGQALRLEWLTIAWMVVEAAVALAAGLAAGSLLLTAFGIDSLIELGSAFVLVWRLTVELRRGRAFPGSVERRASRIGGALLFALAAYIVAGIVWSLWRRHGEAFSWAGLIVALLALPVMTWLGRRKLALAAALGSAAMRADAAESLTCFWLSLVVVIGQACEWLLGAWWVDPLASAAVLCFVVREAREAWSGEGCCDDCGG